MEKLLNELVDRLRKAYGDRLLSVILYGSAAAGDYRGGASDLNVFCVLQSMSPAELRDGEATVKWWREQGNPSPVLMSAEEVRSSTDSFPLEFSDLLETRKVLFGSDPIAGLSVDETHYRILVEHELRAKLLRLRQKAAGILSDRDLLLRLMMDSISTFAVLARHSARLAGRPAPATKREAIRAAFEAFGMEPRASYTLLDLRDGAVKPRGVDSDSLFELYLREIEALVAAVDRLVH
jgi:hypothetical protein